MDPDYVDEEEEASAMAARMGFSGFGTQKPPAKKRKFTTDAFVEGQELSLLVDKGVKTSQGSGGNAMPLGKNRVFGTASASKVVQSTVNDSEIAFDYDEADGPQYVDTSLPPPILAGAGEDEGPQRPHLEPPPGVSDEEAKEMQSRINAILAFVESREPAAASAPPPPPSNQQVSHKLPQRPNFPPPKPPNDLESMRGGLQDVFSDSASVASPRPSHRGGLRNKNWYLDYYDPSFNENPWAKLEKEKGLEPLGRWPEGQRSR